MLFKANQRCDGDVRPVEPLWHEAGVGVTGLLPIVLPIAVRAAVLKQICSFDCHSSPKVTYFVRLSSYLWVCIIYLSPSFMFSPPAGCSDLPWAQGRCRTCRSAPPPLHTPSSRGQCTLGWRLHFKRKLFIVLTHLN